MKLRRTNKKKHLFIIVGAILAVCIFALFELTGITNFILKDKATSGVIPAQELSEKPQSGNDSSSSDNSDTQSSAIQESPKRSSGTISATPGEGPTAPSGNFVSNHRPNLSGSPAPSSILSVCNTTPGAMCYIEFKYGSAVKSLKAAKANESGAVYWSWDVRSAGFTIGSWEITATATLDNKSTSTKDSLKLEVEQ